MVSVVAEKQQVDQLSGGTASSSGSTSAESMRSLDVTSCHRAPVHSVNISKKEQKKHTNVFLLMLLIDSQLLSSFTLHIMERKKDVVCVSLHSSWIL